MTTRTRASLFMGSPYRAGLGRMHRRSRCTRERLRELRQVAEGTVDAELERRVRIDGEQHLREVLAVLAAPRLPCPEEELLILGETVRDDLTGRILAQRAIRAECHLHAAHVRDVFAERELAVDELLRQHLERVVHGRDALA